jgi:hypothetical protein
LEGSIPPMVVRLYIKTSAMIMVVLLIL